MDMHDLNIVMDDASGENLHGEFVEQEGLLSTWLLQFVVLGLHRVR